ncbi:MAG: phenylalanine--tRNA ligase subunit alpha [Bacteroidia bacterium]|nr:phenylalanine--tRNA ligase subunit alpha [Bacteroidia bacterium]
MLDRIEQYKEELINAKATNEKEAEELRIRWLGKKGIIQELMEQFRLLEGNEKKTVGKPLNELKQLAEQKIQEIKKTFSARSEFSLKEDPTLPPYPFFESGGLHPLTLVRKKITWIFTTMGYSISEGPEIEDDWHNFTALNTPEDHPARDMQDTFYITLNPLRLLRTQTSSVQVHVMENGKLPIRTISPGRVYRNETVSARAHFQFHQVEGLVIDKGISFADLKLTLQHFATGFFGPDTKIRMRPSYFPFTEPSAEVDVSCSLCGGKGCHVCKHTGWVEIMGCGMVDPAVLENCKINPAQYSGFAFGMGIERLAMLKYQIPDLRLFFENDIRFLKNFKLETAL